MNYLVPLSEIGSYLFVSILMGHVALLFVPEDYKPNIRIPKKVLLLATLGVYIFGFGPVAQTISYFSESVGLSVAAYSVLTDFQVGRAWIVIGFMSMFLWIALLVNSSKYIQALLLLVIVLAIGYSSHVASLEFWNGLFAHTIHYFMVTLWVGILLQGAWFSDAPRNWGKFLQWFTPFAVGSIIVILISGFLLMLFVVDPKEYADAWVLPYGQMLLLKHISIIPVLAFAFLNGVLSKKSISSSSFNPLPWLKGETILLFITFYFTSILGTISPPHEVEFTVKSEGASKWVEWLFGKDILTTLNIELHANLETWFLSAISVLFLGLVVISFKKVKPAAGVFFALSFIFTMYFGLMLSLSV